MDAYEQEKMRKHRADILTIEKERLAGAPVIDLDELDEIIEVLLQKVSNKKDAAT